MVSGPASLLSIAAALFSQHAAAVHLEVYYGPYCPNSASYLSINVKPMLDMAIPGLVLTMLPYALDPATGVMPTPCPSRFPGTPCGVLAAPLCALQPFVSSLPHAMTPDYVSATKFAICDLVHANHGAPAFMTHTKDDIHRCAEQSDADWGAIEACLPGVTASAAYIAKMTKANERLPGGKMAPFIFVDGQFVENADPEPLWQRICRLSGPNDACDNALASGLFEANPLVAPSHTWHQWATPLFGFGGLVGAVLVLAVVRPSAKGRKKEEPADARRLMDDTEDSDGM